MPFKLPEANGNMRRVYAYLMKQRYIDAEVISHFARAKTLYEDSKYHNAVFVGHDGDGVPRHAHKRSTLTVGEVYRGNVESSDPRYSFHHIGTSGRLYVYEAPVDMLSFLTMHPDRWQRHSHVALCGVSPQAMFWMMQQKPDIQEIALCLDNDAAGNAASERIAHRLRQADYDVSRLLSQSKDWNADLQAMRGGAEHERDPCATLQMA